MGGNPILFIRHAVPCHQIKITIWLAVIYSSKIEFTRREKRKGGWGEQKQKYNIRYLHSSTD